jgi:hypothetical protein
MELNHTLQHNILTSLKKITYIHNEIDTPLCTCQFHVTFTFQIGTKFCIDVSAVTVNITLNIKVR